jgi:predicted nucleotidyltransferase
MHILPTTRRFTRAPYRRSHTRGAPVPRSDIDLYVDEAVTRTMVESVIEEVRDLRDRLMTFFFMIAAGIVIDILTRTWGH